MSLNDKTVAELKNMANKAGIPGYSNMKKAELINALSSQSVKVRAVKSFGSTEYGHFSEGAVFELPKGVDWLKAGLVEEVKETKKREAAARPNPEKR